MSPSKRKYLAALRNAGLPAEEVRSHSQLLVDPEGSRSASLIFYLCSCSIPVDTLGLLVSAAAAAGHRTLHYIVVVVVLLVVGILEEGILGDCPFVSANSYTQNFEVHG